MNFVEMYQSCLAFAAGFHLLTQVACCIGFGCALIWFTTARRDWLVLCGCCLGYAMVPMM